MGNLDHRALDAARMAAYVSDVAAEIVQRWRVPLDFSVDSLRFVDRILSSVRAQNASAERAERIACDLGGYLGEVLVRRHGATWVDLGEAQRELWSVPLGVRMPDERIWNPIGVARKRIERQDAAPVHHFYLTVHGRYTTKDQRAEHPTQAKS
ncbi:hypothetical protein [Streptomyces boninensis]|uniref:hypothetical protein n=1 Tax=Streptomyces boninensis TaxID=2039455 RepID=UPI003B20EE6D